MLRLRTDQKQGGRWLMKSVEERFGLISEDGDHLLKSSLFSLGSEADWGLTIHSTLAFSLPKQIIEPL